MTPWTTPLKGAAIPVVHPVFGQGRPSRARAGLGHFSREILGWAHTGHMDIRERVVLIVASRQSAIEVPARVSQAALPGTRFSAHRCGGNPMPARSSPRRAFPRPSGPFIAAGRPAKDWGPGLAVISGIIGDNKDNMKVDSVLGQETAFPFRLPVVVPGE